MESESSRRLRESLDELTGPDDVRIEDTGVEWRVLNDELESDEMADDEEAVLPVISASDERRYDDNTPLPENSADDGEDDYAPPLVPGRRATDQLLVSPEFDERQSDLALSEPEDWTDLLDEVRHPGQPDEEELPATDGLQDGVVGDGDEPHDESRVAISDEDFDGPEDALTDEVPLLAEPPPEATTETAPDEPQPDSAIEVIVDDSYPAVEDTGVDDAIELAADAPDGDADERQETGEFEAQIEAAARAFAAGADEADSLADTGAHSPAADKPDSPETDDLDGDADIERIAEFVVLPPSEDEMSVNMEIDQELMAAAVQDDEFSATLVGMEKPEWMFDENAEGVETIIMEGDFVSSAIDEERLAAENAARNQLGDPDGLFDTYAASRQKPRVGRRMSDLPPRTMLAAAAVLAIVLAGQFVHQSRASLATVGMFNHTLTPVYELLGEDLTPHWDVTGWQFETTSGSVDDANTTLTIVSRLTNRHSAALPYPLLHVSLTDRWEEIVGSKVLKPQEYLAGNLDRERLVEPGDTFTAVIAIGNTSAEATGFKLNVCYAADGGRVRCAIQDFKN